MRLGMTFGCLVASKRNHTYNADKEDNNESIFGWFSGHRAYNLLAKKMKVKQFQNLRMDDSVEGGVLKGS